METESVHYARKKDENTDIMDSKDYIHVNNQLKNNWQDRICIQYL